MRPYIYICCLLLGLTLAVFGLRGRFEIPPRQQVLTSYGAAKSEHLEGEFSLLVWNIHKGKDKNWRKDLERLAGAADLIFLQEVQLPRMKTVFSKSDTTAWNYAVSYIFKKSNSSTGVAIGSKTQLQETKYLRSPFQEPIIGTPKMAVVGKTRLTNTSESLMVANVHTHLATGAKKAQGQLQAIAEVIAQHEGPVIWAGDFNTWSKHRYRQLEKITKSLGLEAVRFTDDQRTKLFGKTLDHVFVREVHVKSSKTLSQITSSDHVPLLVNLTLEE